MFLIGRYQPIQLHTHTLEKLTETVQTEVALTID